MLIWFRISLPDGGEEAKKKSRVEVMCGCVYSWFEAVEDVLLVLFSFAGISAGIWVLPIEIVFNLGDWEGRSGGGPSSICYSLEDWVEA